MRILQIAPPWFTVPPRGYGGIERVVSLLTDGLVDAGHEVTLAASGGSSTKARLLSAFDLPPSDHLGEPAYDLQHCVAAFRDLSAFDVVHDHSGLIAAVLGSMNPSTPFVHTVHGSWEAQVVPVYGAIADTVRLIAISKSQRDLAPDTIRIADVVYNGIDVASFPFRGAEERGSGVLAFVGRATPDKGAEMALAVARELDRPLRMAMKVNEPPEHRYWNEVLLPLMDGLDVDITLNADRSVAAQVMASADVTLMPIRWPEPFGLVMVESMAVGTPVVAFANGAASEVVADGHSGVLVHPDGDVQDFCAAVERAAALSPQHCRAWVSDRFSAAAMVSCYEAVYRRATGHHGELRLAEPAMA